MVTLRTVSISEARTRLGQLVEEAASGQDVIIARHGRAIARLTRLVGNGRKRRLGILDERRLRIPDDFNRPLPSDVQGIFDGER